MNICSIEKFEEILSDLALNSSNLTSIAEIDEFLSEDYGFKLEELLNSPDNQELVNDLTYLLKNVFNLDYDHLLNRQLNEIALNNNIITIFRSPEITPLFHTMNIAENYFEKSINEKIVKVALLGSESDTRFVFSDKQFNSNIKTLKNKLLNNIRLFLKLPLTSLYDEEGNFIRDNYSEYQYTLQLLETKLKEGAQIKSYSGNTIPLLGTNLNNSNQRNILDVYNSAIFLTNFDNIIEKYFKDIIEVDFSTYNSFEDSPTNSNKYSLRIKGLETTYFKDNTHDSNSVEYNGTKLSKLLISSIPQLNKEGEATGEYLSINDFYRFSALLKEFELLNYNSLKKSFDDWVPFNEDSFKMIDWYLDKIQEFHLNRVNGLESLKIFKNYFDNSLEFVNSIKSFFEQNNLKIKEANNQGSVKSILNQVINNCTGSTYLTYNASSGEFEVTDLYKQNANETSIQNSIYNKLAISTSIFSKEKDESILTNLFKTLPSNIDCNYKNNLPKDIFNNIDKAINYKLGLTLTYDNIFKMLSELSDKEGMLTRERLKSYFINMYSIANKSLPAIEENENFKNSFPDKVKSESFVITELVNLPITREIIHRFMDSYMAKPIMNISTLSGEKIPVYKVVNLVNNDVSLMRSHEEQFKNKNYKNIFTSSTDPVLLNSGTKLELTTKNANKSAFKFSASESFTSNFIYDYHKAIDLAKTKSSETGIPNGFFIMLGNYSDKVSVPLKQINVNTKLDNSNVPIIAEKMSTILNKVRSQSYDYYSDLMQNIFEQYNNLFSLIGKDEKLDLNFKESNTIFDNNINIISKYLIENSLSNDLKIAFDKEDPNNRNLNFIEELHYSKYSNSEYSLIGLNQTIVNYYKIFNDVNIFNQFVKDQEDLFTSKYNDYFNNSKVIDFQTDISSNEMKRFCINSGENYDNYILNYTENNQNLLLGSNGSLNPLLKRWIWINALFRNEYLYMSTKGEYMHPHKLDNLEYTLLKVKSNNGKISTLPIKYNFEAIKGNFYKEIGGRLITMAKRNVAFTSTFELPVRSYNFGIPEKINAAVINDFKSEVYNILGETKNQEVHDGSSIINYLYSKMVNASYPTKGYKNTKKQFGTLISAFGSGVKKDAETVLTNALIRNSANSLIRLKNIQRKMLSIPIDEISIPNNDIGIKDKLFIKNGKFYSIISYEISNGNISVFTNQVDKNLNYINSEKFNYKATDLYSLWEAFGGEDSIDNNFEFSEGSNDLLYNLITSYKPEENYPLRDKMIHIVSSKSAWKSGATNINSSESWVNTTSLMFSTFEHRQMGIQLDANHDPEESQVREVSQVVSALAQSLSTMNIANQVYNDLAIVIKNAAEPYKGIVIKNESTDKIYNYIAKKFFESVVNSKNSNLAKTIIESFPADMLIPYSNQHFYNLFIRDIISRMNSEFITRYYSGIGVVLNPSHGMVQLYEDNKGNVYTQEDIKKKALYNYNPTYEYDENNNIILDSNNKPKEKILSNEEILSNYIQDNFKAEEVKVEELNPGDSVIIEEVPLFIETLDTIEKYIDFKNKYKGKIVKKSYSSPRDLKPTEITFKLLVTNSIDNSPTFIQNNLFDIEPIRLRFALNNLKKADPNDLFKLKEFAKYFNIDPKNPNYLKTMDQYLNAWTQRNLDLLDKKLIMKDSSFFEYLNDEGEKHINFNKLFFNNSIEDSLINNIFSEVEQGYDITNTEPIYDYTFKPAEMIMPNIYKSTFKIGNKSISSLTEAGPSFFKDAYNKEFSTYDKTNDLKLILGDGNKSIGIKLVTHLPSQSNSLDFKQENEIVNYTNEDKTISKEWRTFFTRIDKNGKKLYTLPQNAVATIENGEEVIYIKAFKNKVFSKDKNSTSFIQIDPNIDKVLSNLLQSFDRRVSMVLPLMNSSIKSYDIVNGELISSNINNNIFKVFESFSGYKNGRDVDFNNDWLNRNKDNISTQLSNMIYASWEKSLYFSSARIPAQSMQSFMPMKNVAYFNSENDSNDAYVSVWQIFLQGSDFDIDKAYNIGYSFNKNGQYSLWTSAFNYSSKEELDELEKLPIPSNKLTKYSNAGYDVSKEFNIFLDYIKNNPDISSYIFPKNVIKALVDVINIIYKNNLEKIYVDSSDNLSKKLFLNIINKHNTSIDNFKDSNSLKNSVVSKTLEIISTPSNQVLANTPVDVKDLKDAVKLNPIVEKLLSSWDMFSYYKQQFDASVGKDDVGIFANGLKVFFALNTYYSNIYNKRNSNILKIKKELKDKDPDTLNNIRRSNDIFLKSLYMPVLKDNSWEWEYLNIATLSDIGINKDTSEILSNSLGKKLTIYKSKAALAMSSCTSAATDNAKELLMAKIKASPEIASMHTYMISLGLTLNQVALFMNSFIAEQIYNKLQSNLFNSTDFSRIESIINSLKNVKDLTIEQKAQLSTFEDIYQGAQEYKILAKILGVNQKRKANTFELFNYLSTFNSAMFMRENSIFSKNLNTLANWNKWEADSKESEEIKKRIINKIISSNSTLTSNDFEYVQKVLDQASNINFGGNTVSILGGNFDFRKYIDTENGEAYRKATIDYYNIIKNTINIFDIIENVPHFKAMIDGVILSYNILLNRSKKYNFVFNTVIDLAKSNSSMLQKLNANIKNIYGNKALPIKITEKIFNNASLLYDKFVVSNWLSSNSDEKNKLIRTPQSISFNVNDLLEIADIDSIKLYNDKAKYSIFDESDSVSGTELVYRSKLLKGAPHTIVDLTSDAGIANFKKIMENIIPVILNKNEYKNNFISSLQLQTVKGPFGIRGSQLVASFNMSKLNNPINIEKFQKLINNFNELDKIKLLENAFGKKMLWRDLFYLYNLVVNNEMNGDKRLTPIFESYSKEPTSLSMNYSHYCAINEDTGNDLNNLNINEESALKDTTLFYLFNNNGLFFTENMGEVNSLKVINPDFVVNTSFSKLSNTLDNIKNINKILGWINNNALVTIFKCS